MNKKISFLGFLRVIMALSLFAGIAYYQMQTTDSNASLEYVSTCVTSAVNLENMEESTHRLFKKFYGLNPNDYEGISFYAPVSNMDAQELLILKLKDSSQAETVENAVKERLETQKSNFEGYGAEQMDLLNHSVLEVRGNFVFYMVHSDTSKGLQAFQDSL